MKEQEGPVIFTGQDGMERIDAFCTGLLIDMEAKKFEEAGYDPEALKSGLFSSDSASRNFTKEVVSTVVQKEFPKETEETIIKNYINRMDKGLNPFTKSIII